MEQPPVLNRIPLKTIRDHPLKTNDTPSPVSPSTPPINEGDAREFNRRSLFIGGCPKSGTTLLLSLLDGHPQLVVLPEETFFLEQYFRRYCPLPTVPDRLRRLLEKTHLQLLGLGQVKRERHVVSKDERDYSRFDYPRFVALMQEVSRQPWVNDSLLFSEVVRNYAVVQGYDWQKCVHWVEKSVCNEVYHEAMDKLFPDAKMVQVLRDPRAMFASVKKALVNQYGAYTKAHRFTRKWNSCTKETPRLRKNPKRFLVVRYEDLVKNPQEQMQAVCRLAGIDFIPELLNPTRAGEKWQGNSAHQASFSGISTAAIDQWKSQLTEHEIWWIELHTRKGMELAGYPLMTDAKFSLGRWLKRLPGESWGGYFRARRASIFQGLGLLKDCRYDQ